MALLSSAIDDVRAQRRETLAKALDEVIPVLPGSLILRALRTRAR